MALLAGGASTALAQQGLVMQKVLSLDMAMKIAQSALAKCRADGYKVGEEVIGAVSVSGAPGWDKDEACSSAGIAKVADKLK